MRILLILFLLIIPTISVAEVVVVPHPDPGFFNKEDTMTMYLKNKNNKAVLIFMPGGKGSIGMKESWKGISRNNSVHRVLYGLVDRGIDVVFVDNPYPLPFNGSQGKDHMMRMESVIRFYKEQTGLPIFLMGHSRGGLSVSEFVEYALEKNMTDLLSVVIMSGSNDSGYRWFKPIDKHMIFLHHAKDGCQNTPYYMAERTKEKISDLKKYSITLITIEEGQSGGDPCNDGYHMYLGAEEEVAQRLSNELRHHIK